MKELMVTLLVLCTTGMVMGQQSTTRSALDDSDFNPSGRSQAQTPGPFLLDINSDYLKQLEEYGELAAPIAPKDMVNEVVFRFDGNNKLKPRADEVPKNVLPSRSSGNGVLKFAIDESGLRRLQTEGLRYVFDAGERGKYDQVVLTYLGRKSTPSPTSNSFGNNTSPEQSYSTSNRRDSNRLGSRLPEPDSVRPYDPTFMGPTFDRSSQDQDRSRDQVAFNNDRQRITPISSREEADRQFARESTNNQSFGNGQWQYGTDRNTFPDRSATLPDRTADASDNWYAQEQARLRRESGNQGTNNDFGATNDHRANQNYDLYRNRSNSNSATGQSGFGLTESEKDALARRSQLFQHDNDRRDDEIEQLRRRNEESERLARLANDERLRLLDTLRDQTSLDHQSVARRRTLDDDYLYADRERRVISPVSGRYPRVAALDAVPRDRLYVDQSLTETERLRMQQIDQENRNLRIALNEARANQAVSGTTSQIDPINRGQGNRGIRDYTASIAAGERVSSANLSGLNTNVGNLAGLETILRQYDGTNLPKVVHEVREQVQAEAAAAKIRTDKFNGFLMFLFLFSFALNLYLAWLAQTFYGRYGELADELRDTFTATT